MTSTVGSASRAWATRPPQKVPSPVTRTRRPIAASAPPDRLTAAEHLVERLLDGLADGLRLLHHPAPGVARLVGRGVERDGVEHGELELRRQVDEQPRRPEQEHV